MFYKEVLEPFLKSIGNYGAHNAFCINGRFYTFSELAKAVSKIRLAIRSKKNESRNIGLIANDDLDTYASIFAIWMEGYAYVPLHPQQPIERSLEIISQSDISIVINSDPRLTCNYKTVIESSSLCFEKFSLIPESTPDEDLAYILFTSGSTGKPKGVKISRKNVGAFLNSFWKTGIQIDENDRCLQCFDLTFDVSVQSFLVPLTRGACTYTIPHDQIKYSYVSGLLEDHQLTFGAVAPSMIRYLRPYFDEIRVPSLRYNILTAEASPLDLIIEWSKCIPHADIYNFYGPTECTIYCTYHRFNSEVGNKQLNGMLSIGKPMHGIDAIITDGDLKVLEKNQKGELCISGDQVTPGYWKNPAKNEESFFETEFKGRLTRFYKTGDSCYFDDEGDIMLAGRLDHQVKIQGYRVELGEIEYHAREYLKGKNAVACSFNNSMDNTEIALFIEGTLVDETNLLVYLRSKLPIYMIPTRILIEENFPLNFSGKVDRILLKNRLT